MAEPAQDQLVFLIGIGTGGVLLLIVFIILFFFTYQGKMFAVQSEKLKRELEFQHQMVEAQLESQEKERVRIASDLAQFGPLAKVVSFSGFSSLPWPCPTVCDGGWVCSDLRYYLVILILFNRSER